ncbi:MAG: hypothetical protein CVU43_06840 [Chloroflexi bacterium HGW-Chloroflexi-5]|jgi:uncharacterized protein (DUF433 family)|nr:MAG: hypothetical protein CVU43_06840 [Chloroflexi bacterium HGW-Chloroflexi-5]
MNGRYSLNLPIDLKQEAEQVAEQQKISLNQLILWSLTEKVTSLKGNLNDPEFPSISYRRDSTNQLIPIIRGKGIRVQTIVIASKQWKESVADICKQYGLSKKMVDDALGFYSAHKKIVDALIEENELLENVHA